MKKIYIPIISLVLCGCAGAPATAPAPEELPVNGSEDSVLQMYVFPSGKGGKQESGYYLEFDLESNSNPSFRYTD